MNDKHVSTCNNGNKNKQKENQIPERVVIPCDVYSYVGKSADEYLKHIETQHVSENANNIKCSEYDY